MNVLSKNFFKRASGLTQTGYGKNCSLVTKKVPKTYYLVSGTFNFIMAKNYPSLD